MFADLEEGFEIRYGSEMLGDFLNLERLSGMRPKNIHKLGLQRNDFTGSLLPGFHT